MVPSLAKKNIKTNKNDKITTFFIESERSEWRFNGFDTISIKAT